MAFRHNPNHHLNRLGTWPKFIHISAPQTHPIRAVPSSTETFQLDMAALASRGGDPTPIRRRVRFSLETTPGATLEHPRYSQLQLQNGGGYHTSFNHRTKFAEVSKPRFSPLTKTFGSPITPPQSQLHSQEADYASDLECDSDLVETETNIMTMRSMDAVRARWRSLYVVLFWTMLTWSTILCLYPTGTVQRRWNAETCGVTSAYLHGDDSNYWKVSIRSASVPYESVSLSRRSRYAKKLHNGCGSFISCGKTTFPCAPTTGTPLGIGTAWPYDPLCTLLSVALIATIAMLISSVNHAKQLWMVRDVGDQNLYAYY